MSAGAIPQQFTGYAAMAKQDALAFKLEKYTYTPRAFTEDDIVIKIDCCGVCGVRLPSSQQATPSY
jgi:alcohol dehydrogenase (NADP+)